MPSDIAIDSISDYQMADLNRLKEWLRKRTQVRLNGERAERRQKKEEEARRKAGQPALFEF